MRDPAQTLEPNLVATVDNKVEIKLRVPRLRRLRRLRRFAPLN